MNRIRLFIELLIIEEEIEVCFRKEDILIESIIELIDLLSYSEIFTNDMMVFFESLDCLIDKNKSIKELGLIDGDKLIIS